MDYQKIIERNVTYGLMYRETPVMNGMSRNRFREITESLHQGWTPELVNAQLGIMDYAVATGFKDKIRIFDSLKYVDLLGAVVRSMEEDARISLYRQSNELENFLKILKENPGINLILSSNHEESLSRYLNKQKC